MRLRPTRPLHRLDLGGGCTRRRGDPSQAQVRLQESGLPRASTFEASVHVRHRLSFDDVAAETFYPEPGGLRHHHVLALDHYQLGDLIGGLAYTARSAPNVLAPYTAGSTLAFGETTLTFARTTRSAGLFLVLVSGPMRRRSPPPS